MRKDELPCATARLKGPGKCRKLKGVARVRLESGRVRLAELHWCEAQGMGRIVDESGEDYLYAANRFVGIELPEAMERSIFKKAS